MDTVAVTSWNGIVSPVFDTAGAVLVVSEDGSQTLIDMSMADVAGRVRLLKQAGAMRVICGAISGVSLRYLEQSSIAVIPWIRGAVADVVDAYRGGTLQRDVYLMPGCARRGGGGMGRSQNQWRRGQCRRNGGGR